MRALCFLFLFFIFVPQAYSNSELKAVSEMSLEEKVGQLFFIGFSGDTMTTKLKKHLTDIRPGAIIVFGRNIKTLKQIAALNKDLQTTVMSASSIPAFIAVDQEGGLVSRIHTAPAMPSAFTIGQTGDADLSYRAGKVTGELLFLLGFNMNLAPVLDITDNKLKSFIGARSFSDSPQKIGNMGIAFARGLSEGKILPVAKHYPGHGPIALDSHHLMPQRNLSLSELMASDLLPFQQFANAPFSSGVMVAHIAYPLIDKSALPATYSKTLITDVLQNQLKYSGLILTDDIEMGGAALFPKLEDRAVAAVNAGNDLIMLAWNHDGQLRARNAILRAVQSGEISIERINASVQKILTHKAHLAPSSARSLASTNKVKEQLNKIPLSDVYGDVFAHYFKNLSQLSTFAHQYEKITLISHSKHFNRTFKKTIRHSPVRFLKLQKDKSVLPNELLVLHVSNQKSFDLLRDLPADIKKQTFVVSTHSRLRIENPAAFLEVVELYSQNQDIGAYAAQAINRAKESFGLLDYGR